MMMAASVQFHETSNRASVLLEKIMLCPLSYRGTGVRSFAACSRILERTVPGVELMWIPKKICDSPGCLN